MGGGEGGDKVTKLCVHGFELLFYISQTIFMGAITLHTCVSLCDSQLTLIRDAQVGAALYITVQCL